MLFVAGEIFVWMLVAFVVGIGVGWAARSRKGSSTQANRRRFR